MQPLLVCKLRACLYAEQVVVRCRVLAFHVVDVVRGHEPKALLARQFNEHRVRFGLFGDAVVHQFDVEVSVAEQACVPLGNPAGAFRVARKQGPRELPLEARAERYKALRVFLENLPVYAGLVVVTLGEAACHYPHEVLVAMVAPRQQHEMIGLLVEACGLVVPTAGSDVHL